MKTNFLFLLVALTLVSCGKDGGSGGSGRQEEEDRTEMVEATPGTYYSVLRPVNFHSNGFIPYGQATFKVAGDNLQVSVSLDDDQAVTHRQSLHLGSRCPTISDDSNRDGFVDYKEALRVVGPVIMPLDADLNSQSAGQDQFLRGPAMTYNKQASLSKINADLGKNIGFEGRVVLVHGTTNQSHFPASLASYNNEPANLSLPVVCGLLSKVE